MSTASIRWARLCVAASTLCSAWCRPPSRNRKPAAQNSETRAARAFEHARRKDRWPFTPSFTKCPRAPICTLTWPAPCMRKAFIREAAEDNLCVNSKTLVLYKTMAMTRSLPPQPVCGEQGEPAANALSNQTLYDQLINVFSMRTFVPTTEQSGHDHFFASFDQFQSGRGSQTRGRVGG